MGDKSGVMAEKSNLPEHFTTFYSSKSIPSYFSQPDCLPPKLALPTITDQTPVERTVNAGYERQKKVNQKRDTQNAIQTVANIMDNKVESKEEMVVEEVVVVKEPIPG